MNQLEIYTCWMAYSRTVFNNKTLLKKGSTKCYKDNQRSMESNGSQYLRRDKGLGRLLTATHSISLPRAVFHCSLLFRFEFYCFSVSLTSVLTSVRELPPMIYAFDLYEIFMITRLVCELLKCFRAVLCFEY